MAASTVGTWLRAFTLGHVRPHTAHQGAPLIPLSPNLPTKHT
jgi:hypothetical protein